MPIFKKLFNADNLVESVKSGIDKSFYTNEEKADEFSKLLGLYEPFKLAQRYLALLISGVYLGVHLTILFTFLFDIFALEGLHSGDLMDLAKWNNDALFYPFLTINAFYFSGGVINSAVARFSRRVRKDSEKESKD